jgi:hypothetical protein
MTTSDPDNQAGEGPADVLSGLEQLAQDLDARRYPGQAWPVAGRRVSRRSVWKVLAPLAAAAAVVVILVHYCTTQWGDANRTRGPGKVVVHRPVLPAGQSSEVPGIPKILIVEDLDSYSIIDLTTGSPLVSFATKDLYGPVCVVPVLPDPPPRATTMGKKT